MYDGMGVDGTRASRRRGVSLHRMSRPWALAWCEALFAFFVSRTLVLATGTGSAAWLGLSGRATDFDPTGVTRPFGGFGDDLVAPFARWDSVWFLSIADGGYGDDAARPAFFPLYPLLARGVGAMFASSLVGGIVVSSLAFVVALALLHRLALVELGDERAARFAVLACAFFPMAFFHTAVYSEGLFLALSVGAVLAARTGAWAWAGALGALAAGTRSAGVLLVVPLALVYARQLRAVGSAGTRREPGVEVLWIALVPAGLIAFCGYFLLAGADARAPFDAQEVWFREFSAPFAGAWDGWVAAFEGTRQLLSGSRAPVYFTKSGGDPFVVAQENLVNFAFLLAAVPVVVGTLRRLPPAYGAYVVCALALPLSTPVAPQPLMSIPRFLAVLFPLYLWAGWWLATGGRLRARVALGVSVVLLVFFSGRFATWHWVA